MAIEQEMLSFIRNNQNALRADLYKGLQDAINTGDTDATAVGMRYIIPSSFTGGPRNMIQHYHDAMAICRTIGFLDLFITFTCNPSRPDIQQQLSRLPGQCTEDRPNIVARVFHIRLRQLMEDLKKNNFFDRVIARIQTQVSAYCSFNIYS